MASLVAQQEELLAVQEQELRQSEQQEQQQQEPPQDQQSLAQQQPDYVREQEQQEQHREVQAAPRDGTANADAQAAEWSAAGDGGELNNGGLDSAALARTSAADVSGRVGGAAPIDAFAARSVLDGASALGASASVHSTPAVAADSAARPQRLLSETFEFDDDDVDHSVAAMRRAPGASFVATSSAAATAANSAAAGTGDVGSDGEGSSSDDELLAALDQFAPTSALDMVTADSAAQEAQESSATLALSGVQQQLDLEDLGAARVARNKDGYSVSCAACSLLWRRCSHWRARIAVRRERARCCRRRRRRRRRR